MFLKNTIISRITNRAVISNSLIREIRYLALFLNKYFTNY